ncbi:hypothetical protein [Bryobacter aggregatus]|uniref:hypothetical protein n=1 Tax=Bryobacter aggregatus TaxID=360054 RepID=UPI0004E205B4|nr:hypothetical protein [Bryobacter aggregatus]
MNYQIGEAVRLLREFPSLNDENLLEILVQQGIEKRLAARLVEFIPMVYCRILFGGSGATFPSVYHRLLADGKLREHELSSDLVWTEITEFARREVENGKAETDIRAIAQYGAEYRAASQLIEKGSAFRNIAFTPMVFNWPEDGPSAVAVREDRNPRWWRFGF